MILKPLLGMMSPAGQRGRLSVLIFHRVLPHPDPLFPDEMHAQQFNRVCGWLAAWFNVLPLDVAARHLDAGTLPARAACITFDDGYADNCTVAMPILQRHGLTATFFIATGFLDGGRMWNDTIIATIRGCKTDVLDLNTLGLGCRPLQSIEDRRSAVVALIDQIKYRPVEERIAIGAQMAGIAQTPMPVDLMMTSDQVRTLHNAGMQIGAHTVSHPILARLSDEQVRQEVRHSKEFLEQMLKARVGLFAYPNGQPGEDYLPRTVDIVRDIGFDAAVSTEWGTSCKGDDLLQIRRFTPWDRSRLQFGARLLGNLRRL
jgi:peptidoglycan/xylan/chitin deacetylase (PgdA/CDA1 family)